jgi:hypothetical protein
LKRIVPMRVSTVSGVVIFAGTSGEYLGGPAGTPPGVCASLAAGAIAIVAAKVTQSSRR